MTTPKKWTPDRDAKLAELYMAGVPHKEIAVALGYREDQWNLVARRRRTLGVKKPAHIRRKEQAISGARGGKSEGGWTEEEVERLRRAAHEGPTMVEVMAAFPDRSYAAVTSRMRALGIPTPKAKPADEIETPARREVAPAFKPLGAPIRLPHRTTATPKPDLAEWQKRRKAMKQRLKNDGGNLSMERKSA